MPDRVALAVDGLEVQYNNIAAVQDVDVTVGVGEVVGLIGPNGAGKTSTLAAIMGLVVPSAGTVHLNGIDITGRPTDEIARSGLALVPEGRNIWTTLTVEENLRLGLLGRPEPDHDDADFDWVTSLFPVVHDFRERRAGLLSGGQQQQVAIAQALLSAPSVLMLDEPSLGLSPMIVSALFEALGEIRDRGVGILLVEQRAEAAIRFADRTFVIRDGRQVLQVNADDADNTDLLTEAYFGR